MDIVYICLITRDITQGLVRATALHKSHHNLIQQNISTRTSAQKLFSLSLTPPLSLILVAKDYGFKTTYVIVLILLLKTSLCLNLLEYAYSSLCHAYSHRQPTPKHTPYLYRAALRVFEVDRLHLASYQRLRVALICQKILKFLHQGR